MYISEVNYCGQTPVHLVTRTCREDILRIVLGCADARALNSMDNSGLCPIDAAFLHVAVTENNLEGSRAIGLPLEQVREYNQVLVSLLVQSKCALYQGSLEKALRCCGGIPSWQFSIQLRRIVIKGLATRRQKLQMLAMAGLSTPERHVLGLDDAGIIDCNAARVQQHLDQRSIHVPTYLRVYDKDLKPERAKNVRSIYAFIWDIETAKYAYQLGFPGKTTMLACALQRLAERLTCKSVSRDYEEVSAFPWYICWLIDDSKDVTYTSPLDLAAGLIMKTTAAHRLMAYLGATTRFRKHIDPAPSPSFSCTALDVMLSEAITDDCRCWCSPQGCTPLTKLLEGLTRGNWEDFSLHQEDVNRHVTLVLKALQVLKTLENGKSVVNPWIFSAILRYYTFAALDLRHTCCCIVQRVADPLPEEEIQEIAEEDFERLELLEVLVEEFTRDYGGNVEIQQFIRGPWAETMREVDQQLTSEVLTEEEHQAISEVVGDWRVFGPVLPLHDEALEKEEVKSKKVRTGLEYWLQQLDQIATDPERPFLD